jgi:dTDP-4-amino-4,6-dideoxygalactose transaminase
MAIQSTAWFAALPIPSYRVPRAVPYWSGASYRAIFRSITGGGILEGASTGDLRSLVMETFGVEEAVLCGSGSLALEIALRAFGVRQGEEVIVPAFCCSAIIPPIRALGALPVLADSGADLNLTVDTVRAALTQKTKAIVVPHLFGNPAEVRPIVDLARKKNICVVDDAAQALGATIDGRLVGSFGDVGILSFGAEKICFGLGGGVVLARKRGFLMDQAAIDLSSPRLLTTVGNGFSTLAWRRWRRWTLPLHLLLYGRNSADPDEPPHAYRKEQFSNLNAAVALTLMQSLHRNIEARRARVRAYCELLANEEGLELIMHRPGSACLTQIIRIARGRRSEDLAIAVADALGRAGYEVQGSYVPIHRLTHASMCLWDNLPHVDRLWPDLVELPCEPNVTLDQIEQIAGIVKAVIKR